MSMTDEQRKKVVEHYLPDVIDKILPLVPHEEGRLRARLEEIKSSAEFAAPEMQLFWWRSMGYALADNIGEPHLPWHQQVHDVIHGTESV